MPQKRAQHPLVEREIHDYGANGQKSHVTMSMITGQWETTKLFVQQANLYQKFPLGKMAQWLFLGSQVLTIEQYLNLEIHRYIPDKAPLVGKT